MKRGALFALAGLLLLAAVALLRGLALESHQLEVSEAPQRALDEAAIVRRFAAGLRFPTLSNSDASDFDAETFAAYRAFLAESHPAAHAALHREVIGGHSLLYTWTGRDPARAPLVLMGHYDVVPADEPEKWHHPPFGGVVADGEIWGRGAIDNKNHVATLLEAVDVLLGEGFQPAQTIYLAFGHDEEIGGAGGARRVAETLAARGVRPMFVLDEGGAATLGAVPFMGDRPVAMVGIAEKGAANVRLIARHEGIQHSSMPPPKTPVGRLATAIDRLEANQRPARITPAVGRLLAALAPELPLAARVVLANRPFSDPLLRALFIRRVETAAIVRTTTAATMMQGSSKENIVPAEARAVVNFRILPGESIESTLAHVRRTIGDESIELETYRSREPSPVSRIDTPGYQLLARTIREVIPGAIVAPWLVSGGTDSRHYAPLSDSVYRFSGSLMTLEDLRGAHGIDERIRVDNLLRGIRFYLRLIENASGAHPAPAPGRIANAAAAARSQRTAQAAAN